MRPISMPNRTDTNRLNAEHSTGPKTPDGKKRSSQNALTHGLTARIAVLPSEDQEEYRLHLADFAQAHNPQGPMERQLVQALADAAWRKNRIFALEARLAQGNLPLEAETKAIATLSLHSQRLTREFERTAAQLAALQNARIAQATQDARDLIDIMEMYEEKGETYDGEGDGFVFTNAEINHAIQARNRERLTARARKNG